MSESPICPCEGFTHPKVIKNPPGQDRISYRVGDYATFRRSLLLPLKDATGQTTEIELLNWRPNAKGDLALQMAEWWAYLADILTFYSDRIATQAYLRTADLPESPQRLIRLLGYRPRPGIAASGVVAALTKGSGAFTLPQGFQIQSKPGPGKKPQIFELDIATLIKSADAIAADPVTNNLLIQNNSVLLQGAVTTVKVDDQLLLLQKGWDGSNKNYALVTVNEVKPEKDPRGKVNTKVIFNSVPDSLSQALANDYRLLKSVQSSHLYQYKANSVIQAFYIHLEAIKRDIKVGDPILLSSSTLGLNRQLFRINQYTEVVWYANADIGAEPFNPPAARNIAAIPIPHTCIYLQSQLDNYTTWNNYKNTVIVDYLWQDVGQLIATPATSFSNISTKLNTAIPLVLPAGSNPLPLLLEDSEGKGISAKGSIDKTSSTLELSDLPKSPVNLKTPLQVLLNLLPVSRGETVNNETLGSGDATIAGQEFVLQKSPLTYLLSGNFTSGNNYKSTLRIWVNGVEWQEVPSFYGQSANATIFVTREDENQKTSVQFGDGVNGARLPSGLNNIVAKYRYGSGKEAPDAGTLSVIVKPFPHLKAIHNPVAVGGGADPDPPQQIRRYAPQSVLTFGRAVSGNDYETIAFQTPGVDRAKAYWTWNPNEQRSMVLIYVGDEQSAVDAAKIALRGAADPNRPINVDLAIAIPVYLSLTLRLDPKYTKEPVIASVKSALLDADRGLFGNNSIEIGESIYKSQIHETCLSIPGVIAVHALKFATKINNDDLILDINYRHDPGEGKFFQLFTENLIITSEVV